MRPWPDAMLAAALQLQKEGKNTREIGEALGITRHAVRNGLGRRGVNSRTRQYVSDTKPLPSIKSAGEQTDQTPSLPKLKWMGQ